LWFCDELLVGAWPINQLHDYNTCMHHPSVSDEDVEEVIEGVLRASRALVAVAARSIARVDETATLPQYRALVALAARGPQKVSALADELGVHASTVTRMCDRLVRKGLIDRAASTESRREVVVALTPAGRSLLDQVTAKRRDAIAGIVTKVPVELRPAMVSALQAFSDAAGELPDPSWAAGWAL
jgi:DNA-binding MarR family transcriptional regulator